MSSPRALLITGATGKQGGSVINALLKANAPFEILALTRNAQSASAQRLLKKSPKIKLVTGDFNALDDVFRKAKEASSAPIWGVFSVTMPGKTEESDGKRLVDAAVANRVSHFVFTSVDRGVNSDTDPTNVPHFITKFHVEKHLAAKAKDANMTWTVLRPVAFFDNLINGFIGKAFSSSFLLRMGTDKKLQFIASSDIGWFAAQSFMHAEREEWKNKSVGLAGDELTWTEMKGIFEEKTGETFPLTYEFLASAINWMVKDLGYMFKWMRDVGFGVDVKEVRRMNPEMKDFGTWLETESDWKKA